MGHNLNLLLINFYPVMGDNVPQLFYLLQSKLTFFLLEK